MNGNLYQNPTFPSNNSYDEIDDNIYEVINEQSYIENILRQNRGKKAKIYVSYPDSSSWQNKIYEGTIVQAGKDHLIVMDKDKQTWYLIRIIYLDYVEFNEKIDYSNNLYKES